MRIQEIEILNYKTTVDFKFNCFKNGLNVFIGTNNVGKSNILEALNAFFNRSYIDDNEVSRFLNHQKVNEYDYPVIGIDFDISNLGMLYAHFQANKDKKGLDKNVYAQSTNLANSLKEHVPKFIYLSRTNDLKQTIQSLVGMLSFENKLYSRILTNANQFMSEIFDSTYKLYFDYRNLDNPQIRLIDEFNDDDILENKSSGTQMAALISLLLSIGLNDDSPNGFIVAIDEPETSLHIGSQKKLFGFLKELSKKHQVLITTHSVVFIDKAHDESIFLVKRDHLGRTDYHLKEHKNENWKSLREILGTTISDGLLLGEYNIVVEGRTEQFLFPTMIEILVSEGLLKLDTSMYNFISAEGSAKIEAFMSILKDKIELPLCLFLDNDKSGLNTKKQIDNKIKFSGDLIIIPKKHNFQESEIEDFLDDDLLYDCINEYYTRQITTGYTPLEELQLKELRSNLKFNEFKKNVEGHIAINYPEANKDLNKMAFSLLIKEKLQSSSQFQELVSNFKYVEKYFLRK
ncbi:ATP-dependent endonuclease [Bacillus cereus group sp. BfR-BA-01309]|uniref:ATP-dependent nuclease n=1 Tax=Bacillus cereus group sp. BfR-BA-01309 TaxID=2920286 RepID=UPI001F568288|nr:AAA family ATPase [Bacillus cereus group sp. BfR-BA-01309]